MDANLTTSPDGHRIAYDKSGTGPALILLHGGGGRRQDWHDAGYVTRLQDTFTMITVDLRGHGESAMPTDPADYAIENLQQDILAAADACDAERFSLWGMSYGGKVGRYLAANSPRVEKCILMGTPLGPGVTGERRQQALDFCAHWPPILQAQRRGRLDLNKISSQDREFLQNFDVSVMLGWVRAMLDWPSVEPADFQCPTLWLIGSEDPHALKSLEEYDPSLAGSQLKACVLAGLDHEQVFTEIDWVLPLMLEFTESPK